VSGEPRGGTSRLLLVEGVPGLGKSTILDGLMRRYVDETPAERLRTVVTLAQTHTYGPLAAREDVGTLTVDDNLRHLDRLVTWLEWLVEGARDAPRTKCVVLVDTLHLTHCLRPGVVSWADVAGIDRRLHATGCRLLLLDAEDDTVRDRTVLARSTTEFIRGYARGRFGDSEGALIGHFQRERDRFRTLYAASAMAKRKAAAEDKMDDIIQAVLEFWLEPRLADASSAVASATTRLR
jgi:hypothetical protein